MTETVIMRGHHLAMLYNGYVANRKFGEDVLSKLEGKLVRLSDSVIDVFCDDCDRKNPMCKTEDLKGLDQVMTHAFGFRMYEAYPFRIIKQRIIDKVKEYGGRKFWKDMGADYD
jgi:hypothetical protein